MARCNMSFEVGERVVLNGSEWRNFMRGVFWRRVVIISGIVGVDYARVQVDGVYYGVYNMYGDDFSARKLREGEDIG